MSITSRAAPSASASAPAAVSALMLCTTPSASGAIVETTGMRPVATRSSTADVLTEVMSPTSPMSVATSTWTVRRVAGEQVCVLAGDTYGVRTVGIDESDQFAADLAEQHHPRHIHHLGGGDAESAEFRLQAKTFEHRRDLRARRRARRPGACRRPAGPPCPRRGGLEPVVDHGVAAVLDDDGRPVQFL